MTKAILVVDMPKSCEQCPLKYIDTGDDAYFGANVYRCVFDNNEISKNERDYYCPLKPMLEKKDVDKYQTNFSRGWDEGYNYCIDEILGEHNEE